MKAVMGSIDLALFENMESKQKQINIAFDKLLG